MDQQEHVSCIPVDNETQSSTFRITKNGKRLTYRMSVIQQPMRARACGAGAKSSADRRPVDPPPIVELQIFEGENADRDITFNMEANYFLFATLEQARPIAHGRVPEEKTRQATVLTGTPVAGMVYLDRPKPAGYFIFPDLSVRHEGVYRLSFSLYEELKKDADRSEERARPLTPGHAHVTHRLEVKSKPFTVFSAKKFPGLTESTSLSRMVAEQGCRVRIRRDVRMRRRESKKDHDWHGYDDEHADARARA
ncbi:Velvet complex subunit 1, partial [Teratosphaeria destructans]